MEIVLVGGGHAHVQVLVALARHRPPGARVTLVSRVAETPYSGMIPGVVAGHFSRAAAHIDLAALCAKTGSRLIVGEARGLDRATRRLEIANAPPLPFNLLSIDVGSEPDSAGIAGAGANAIPLKPISSFLDRFETFRAAERRGAGARDFVVVGGGAGGFEIVLALRARLRADARAVGGDPDRFAFTLISAGGLLPTHLARARGLARAALTSRGVSLLENQRVERIEAEAVYLANGARIRSDARFLATNAAAPAWFAQTGLPLDERGFLAVGRTLQSTGDPDIFAAGDCATLVESPREKSGVYAVRAGPPLAANLYRRALCQPALPWRPQANHLTILTMGDREAIAARGAMAVAGGWVWYWKRFIDQRFMARYQV